MSSKLIGFTLKLTKFNNIYMINATKKYHSGDLFNFLQ